MRLDLDVGGGESMRGVVLGEKTYPRIPSSYSCLLVVRLTERIDGAIFAGFAGAEVEASDVTA
jgi:hypothetical protein